MSRPPNAYKPVVCGSCNTIPSQNILYHRKHLDIFLIMANPTSMNRHNMANFWKEALDAVRPLLTFTGSRPIQDVVDEVSAACYPLVDQAVSTFTVLVPLAPPEQSNSSQVKLAQLYPALQADYHVVSQMIIQDNFLNHLHSQAVQFHAHNPFPKTLRESLHAQIRNGIANLPHEVRAASENL